MADRSLSKTYFPLYRKTTGDSTKSNPDPHGYFSCRESTTRFLDLQAKAAAVGGLATKNRSAYTRSTVLADGTKLTPKVAGETITVAESQVSFSIGGKGSRTVTIKTGGKIADRTVNGKTIRGGYHTVSFRFPGWATVEIISDALGTLIDAAKLDVTPTAAKIYPYFTVKGGKKYIIMERAAAKEDTTSDVPTNSQEADTLATQAGIKRRKGAGGDA